MCAMRITEEQRERSLDDLINSLYLKADLLWLSEEEIGQHLLPGEQGEWNALRTVLLHEKETRRIAATRIQLQNKVRAKLILEWLDKHLKSTTDHEKRQLERVMSEYLTKGAYLNLRTYMSDVLRKGPQRADKKRKRDLWLSGASLAGYAWEALCGIARLGIVFGIFTVTATKFEVVVAALLTMIYFAIYSVSSAYDLRFEANAFKSGMTDKRLRVLLKEEQTTDDRDIECQEQVQTAKVLTRSVVRFWIRGGFLALVWLVALFKLISTILG